MSKWERIDDILTAEGKHKLKAGLQGDVLIFEFEGSPVYLKLRRKYRDGAVWAERLDPKMFLTPDQADEEVEIILNQPSEALDTPQQEARRQETIKEHKKAHRLRKKM